MSQTPLSARDGSGDYKRLETHDFDELADALVGIDVDLRQVSSGLFRGELEQLALGPVQIVRTVVNRTVQARGAVDAHVTLFSQITPACEGARWRGRHRKHGEINVNLPATAIDHLTGPVYDSITIVANTGPLLAVGESLLRVDVGSLLRGSNAYRPDPNGFAALEACVLTVLDRARSGRLDSAAERTRWEQALIGKLLNTLVDKQILAEIGRRSSRKDVARQAEEFMVANLRRPLMMTELCRQLAVSERTLRYAFHDCFGVSPLAYFKSLKLNEIRRQYAAVRAGTSVQEVARQWGVSHLGNFAAEYRRLFGERPSETVRRGRQLQAARG